MEDAAIERASLIVNIALEPLPSSFNFCEGLTVANYYTFNDAVADLEQNDFNKQLNNSGVIIKLHERAHTLNERQAEALLAKFGQDRSILLAFESATDGVCLIYWKAAGRQEFLYIELKKEQDGQDSGIFQFVLSFVLNSIKNQHPGCKEEILNIIEGDAFELSYLELCDHRDYNLIMSAVESKNSAIVSTLIKLEFNLNDEINGRSAADIAWNCEHLDILLQLLRNNSVFPKDFDLRFLSDGELKDFVVLTEEFYQYLHAKDKDKVKNILQENSDLRTFFNFLNKSAISVVIEMKDLELYELLISNNVKIGSNEDFEEIMKKLSDNELYKVRKIHDKHAIAIPERHVMTLLQNSKFSHDDQNVEGKTNYILQALLFLNQIPQITLILMIVAAVKNFTITYDFKRTSVHFVDPTSSKNDRGVTYLSGMIYIGAKQFLNHLLQLSAYATLGHELGHFAMDLVYDNLCKPYHKSDKVNRDRFEEICQKCWKLKGQEDVIENVFNYPSDQWHAELIVRIPHMIAEYQNNPDKLDHLLGVFKSLNDYYNDKVLKDMEKILPDIQNKAKVKFEKAQRKAKMRKRWNICLGLSLVFVLIAAGCSVYAVYDHFKPEPIYSWRNLTEELKASVENSTISFQGYNVAFQELLANNSKALSLLSSDQIKAMLKNKSLTVQNKFQSNVEFYVERKFAIYDIFLLRIELNFGNLTRFLGDQNVIILSDKAGTGKTTVYKKLVEALKERFKQKWVSYFDLKKHLDAYEANSYEKYWDEKKLVSFIGKDLLHLNKSVEFAVFEERFNSDNVILLWDGVDEISPHFKDFITELFTNIKEFSNNSQWISTRPQYKDILKEKLNQEYSFSLKPYSKEDRVEFLRSFFTFNNLTTDLIEEKIQLFNEKIKDFDKGDRYDRSDLDSPLIIRMFSELLLDSSNSSLQFENRYLLYKEFVSKSFHIASDKGRVVTEDLQKIAQNQKTNMYKIYEHFALKLVVGKTFNLQIERMPIKLSFEEISRYGIMLITSNDDFDFIHRTFAEFFVAQYLIDNVYQPDVTPRDEEIDARMDLLSDVVVNGEDRSVVLDFINDYFNLNLTQNPDETFTKVAEKRVLTLTDALMKDDCSSEKTNVLLNWLDLIPIFVSDDEEFLKNLWRFDKVENLFIYLTKTHPELNETVLSLARKYLLDEFTDEKIRNMSIEHAGNILFNYWYFNQTEEKFFYPEIVLTENLKNSSNFKSFLNETKEILTRNQLKLMIQTNIYGILAKIEAQDISQFYRIVNETLSKEEVVQSYTQSLGCHSHSDLGERFGTEDEDYAFTLIDEFEKFSDKTVIEIFLKNENILEYSGKNKNAKVFEKVAKFAERNLKTEDFNAILSNRYFISNAVYYSSIATSESLLNFLKEVYASNESALIKLLNEEDKDERTILDIYSPVVYTLRIEPFRIFARNFLLPYLPTAVSSFDPSLTFNSNFYSVLERFVEAKLNNSSELLQALMYYATNKEDEFKGVVSLPENLTLSALNDAGFLYLDSLEDLSFSDDMYRDFFLAKISIDRIYNAGKKNDTSASEVDKLFRLFNYITGNLRYQIANTLILNYVDYDTTQVKAFPPLIREKVKKDISVIVNDFSCDYTLLKFFSKDEELLHLLLVQSLISKYAFNDLECIKPVYDTVNIPKILQNEQFRNKILERLEDAKADRIRDDYDNKVSLRLRDFKLLFPDLIKAFKSDLKI